MSDTPISPLAGALTFAGPAPGALQSVGLLPARQPGGVFVTWPGIANGGAGQPLQLGAWNRAYFAASGTFGSGGSVQVEGSNDGATWTKLSPAALTGAGLFAALGAVEMPLYVRPHVTAGDGTTAITVTAWLKP